MTSREDTTFIVDGTRCAAWLYRPDTAGPYPVIVMAHGLGAVRQMRLDNYARRFQAAGYACLVFDYRHFGASEGEPRQLLDVDFQLEDWRSAIEFARAHQDLDPSRIIVWGTSFGGGHAIITAAGDERIVAAIAQCPFTDGFASALAIDPRTAVKVIVRALRDAVGARFGRAPLMIATAGPPRSAALMSVADALAGYLDLVPHEAPFRNEVSARIALRIMRHFPGRYARRVTCPILFAVCQKDTVAPAKATVRHARRARLHDVRVYPVGHFEIYGGSAFDKAISDQLGFLQRHVPPAS